MPESILMATDAQIDIGISLHLWPDYFCGYQVESHMFVRFIYAICEFFYPISSGITMNPAEFYYEGESCTQVVPIKCVGAKITHLFRTIYSNSFPVFSSRK